MRRVSGMYPLRRGSEGTPVYEESTASGVVGIWKIDCFSRVTDLDWAGLYYWTHFAHH